MDGTKVGKELKAAYRTMPHTANINAGGNLGMAFVADSIEKHAAAMLAVAEAMTAGIALPDMMPEALPPLEGGPEALPPLDAGPEALPPLEGGPEALPPLEGGPAHGEPSVWNCYTWQAPVSAVAGYKEAGMEFQRCSAKGQHLAHPITNLPCTGMRLENGDMVEITVRRLPEKLVGE